MAKRILLGLCAVIFLVILYFLFWPVPIDPSAWSPPEQPELTGAFAPNNCLSKITRLGDGVGIGPEAVALDSQGNIYTGYEDGRIMHFQPDGTRPEEFCNTGGRPLGLKFNSSGGLIVADALKGLLSVDSNGNISVLTDSVNGRHIMFADDLAIAADGMIYFSDASRKFQIHEFMFDLFEHRPNGSLLAYDPKTKETTLLLDELYFANGVCISPDQAFVLVNETGKYRIKRYWLNGPKKGQTDIFCENLVGFPDNITFDGQNTYWVALAAGPKARQNVDPVLPKPFMRKILFRMPEFLSPPPIPEGNVLGINLKGEVTHHLQDPTGNTFTSITSVIKHDDMLYLGSLSEDAIGRIRVP
jgi:sugar lactone lactonase YvrE